jgi:hypothetical protein
MSRTTLLLHLFISNNSDNGEVLPLIITNIHTQAENSERRKKKILRTAQLKLRRKPVKKYHKKSRRYEMGDITSFNIHLSSGLPPSYFIQLYRTLQRNEAFHNLVVKFVPVQIQFLIGIQFLHENPKLIRLAREYQLSVTTTWRIVKNMVLKIAAYLPVKFPNFLPASPFEGAIGAVDATHHPRSRVHPNTQEWYRPDKSVFFIGVQIVTDLQGRIFDYCIVKGHNNDPGTFLLRGIKDIVLEENIGILADAGYRNKNLISPNVPNKSERWHHVQKSLRSVVELAFSFIKTWEFARVKVRCSPEFQTLALHAIYSITAWELERNPIRSEKEVELILNRLQDTNKIERMDAK